MAGTDNRCTDQLDAKNEKVSLLANGLIIESISAESLVGCEQSFAHNSLIVHKAAVSLDCTHC